MGHMSLFTQILGDVLFLRFSFTFHRFCIANDNSLLACQRRKSQGLTPLEVTL